MHLRGTVLLRARTRKAPTLTPFVVRWTAVLGLLLLVFAATAETRHFHSTGNDAQRCSVCVVAHSPTLMVRTAAVAPVKVSHPVVTLCNVAAASALSHDAHCIRPPPALASV
ncbi:MAG: hypothetical protein HYX28_07325 [Candidatus Koribacter versatilis]|uniref:Uncharacterized protein n=1 Tax=Candidatus Korobacter versatilis TaxID=658062 RepID=A0A932A8S4_9BACT|nr:hypothetical protein [Candidatus Koribacter versatilis]